MAQKSGLSRYLISQIENGDDINITKNTMISIAEALGKKVTEIFSYSKKLDSSESKIKCITKCNTF